jgi:phosphatidylglycerophosphatase A
MSLALFVLMSAWLCQKGERILGEKDSQTIVLDEMAGFLLANFLLPPDLKTAVAAFLLFRFFDIIKVFPAAQLEPLKNGVLLDDLVAGFYTLLVLHLLIYSGLL